MRDDNWDLIDGNVAHDIEVLNYLNTVNVIEALVRYIMHHAGPAAITCPHHPNEVALKELHRTGTLFLLAQPGTYRTGEVVVSRPDGTVVHRPPAAADVQHHMDDFFLRLGTAWPSADEVEVGALALWMLNWVHPFQNGNGRTARAFCYACICLKLGFVPGGSPTVIDQIMMERAEYEAALKAADLAFTATGVPDLTDMNSFIERLLRVQLSSIPAK